ncbi:sialate O-acetylesterase [Microbacterium karelineae]|uniref:sialate O-acetylesterase n=1 Tax=Microbacterium karelineae TaxID=2654283 RepID=UPI0018D31DF0|nr:sialate O-acetylesterase [Microbacterium karelineae]
MSGRYRLVLVLGQSNANGSNTDFEPDGQDARDPRIDAFPGSGDDAGTIVPAREPLAPIGGHPPGGLGPGGPFASLLLTTLPAGDRILIVPVTMGGTGMRRHGTYPGVWKVGFEKEGAPNLFDAAVRHTRAALAAAGPDARIDAVIWHQGESDGGRSEDDYAADLDELILALRVRVPEASEAPFIVGQMAAERRIAFPDHAGVAEALRRTPDRIPLTGYAEAPPVGHINDASTHFTAAGQRILGANCFAAYQAIAQSRGAAAVARG